jgi:predicted DNA-binding transcriptional regulator AlpA
MRQQLVFSRLRAPAAAAYLGLSQSTLAKMRIRGDGPAYHKIGPRVVAYSIEDLDVWLKTGRRLSTSDQPPAAA